MIFRKKQACLIHMIILCLTGSRVLIGGFVMTCSVRDENATWFWISYVLELIIYLIYFMGGVSIIYFFSYGFGFFDLDDRASNDYSIILVFAPGYAVGILLKAFPLLGIPMASGYFLMLSIIITKNIQFSVHLLQSQEETLVSIIRLKILKRFKVLSFYYCHIMSIMFFIFTVLMFKKKSSEILTIFFYLSEAVLLVLIILTLRPRKLLVFTQDFLFDHHISSVKRIFFMKTDLNSSFDDFQDEGAIVVHPGNSQSVSFASPMI
jgi:hypothetical protein